MKFRWIEIWIILNKNRKTPKKNFEPYQLRPKVCLIRIFVFVFELKTVLLRERRLRHFGCSCYIRHDASIYVPILIKADAI